MVLDCNKGQANGGSLPKSRPRDGSRMTAKTEPQVSAIRPDLRSSISGAPPSPYTPQRGISSTYSSPGPGFSIRRLEDYRATLELGARYLRVGNEGEAAPQCITKFGPEDTRRHGDYRGWQSPSTKRLGTMKDLENWGDKYELWSMDLKKLDLGLLGDKLERAIRHAYTNHLLNSPIDHRLVLVVPSILPKPIISSVLTRLFNRWRCYSIGLLPSPTMAIVSAGVRSALVVDIGWRETIVTAIYEFREVSTIRTTRAMRLMTQEMARTFISENEAESINSPLPFDFDFAEDLIFRLAWCKQLETHQKNGSADSCKAMEQLALSDAPSRAPTIAENAQIKIDWPEYSVLKDKIFPFSIFAEPAERTFFSRGRTRDFFDDDDVPLPEVIFGSLIALPPDLRAVCMSRMVFVGGGSKIPGLSQRILSEVGRLREKYGWDHVRGKRADLYREKRQAAALNVAGSGMEDIQTARERMVEEMGSDQPMLRSVDRDVLRQSRVTPIFGVFRQVDSLGSWAGASLISSLKVKGLVEVEKDEFLQHGLTRAHRDGEVSIVAKRSHGPNVPRGGERSSWTLAGWA